MAEAAHDLAVLSPEPTAELLQHPGLFRLQVPETEVAVAPVWSCRELAGRLCELSAGPASATLTAAFGLVLDAQLAGEPVAWVTASAATFFPPDAAAGGVDLSALVVVRTGEARTAGRAADVLLRSGAYGLVILDLGLGAVLSTPLQGRLVQLALKHDAAVVCLTEKPTDGASLGSLVSLRCEVDRRRTDTGFAWSARAVKDKRRGPGWSCREVCRGPDGVH